MRIAVGTLLAMLVGMLIGMCVVVTAQEMQGAGQLSELQLLKAQNLVLKSANLELQKQDVERQLKVATEALQKEQQLLEQNFIATLGCKDGLDWKTLGCVVKETSPKKEK